jgi:hypothetical protein
MPKLGLAFQLLSRSEPKKLVELCPEVRDVPWSELSHKERTALTITHEFLTELVRLGLVQTERPEWVTVLPSSIPHLRFYRVALDGEQYVNQVVESAIYVLQQKKALLAHMKESA